MWTHGLYGAEKQDADNKSLSREDGEFGGTGSPTPRQQTSTSPGPLRNQAA